MTQAKKSQGMTNTFVRTAGRLLARLARNQTVQNGILRLASAYRQEQNLSAASSGHEIAEVLPIDARRAKSQGKTRLNLLVPAVSQCHVFGGIETALQAFDALRPYFDQARIIVTDEAAPQPRTDAYYGNWPIVTMASDAPPVNHIVPAGSRWAQTLPVHEQDHFMATAWWTAHNALALLSWQQMQVPEAVARRMLYLIQDYEPGFYPWSSRYLLARATYEQPLRTIALMNSKWLADYLQAQGYVFPTQRVLQPRLHPVLAAVRSQKATFAKERIVLVYGRPSTERNAFSLIVASLRIWAIQYSQAAQWRLVSAGEDFAPIDLGNACTLHSVGKLDIEEYADLLSRTAVGFSLMVSPHPSYPPLEMAAFGVHVVINRFANKDLSAISPLLVPATPSNPAGFAAALLALTKTFDANGAAQVPVSTPVQASEASWLNGFIQPPGQQVEWASDLAAELLSTAPSPIASA
jgi:hypothetical protein